MIEVKSTKSYLNLPAAHCQYHDLEPDGTPGECSSLHGYDRSIHLEFSGIPDEQGWIYPFGELHEVKEFIEYYFDHVSLFPANDLRLLDIPEYMFEQGEILGTHRVLPYGVSMEMSSLFIWEQVNPYIMKTTNGRVYLSRVESREHERNSAFLVADRECATKNYNLFKDNFLVKKRVWNYINPQEQISKYIDEENFNFTIVC